MTYQSLQLVHGSLTSGTHTSWNLNWLVAVTYIIKSRPISVKTKSSFPLVTYYYCFSARAVALPGWRYSHSPNNNPPSPSPSPPGPSKDIQQQQHLLLFLCGHKPRKNKQFVFKSCAVVITLLFNLLEEYIIVKRTLTTALTFLRCTGNVCA